MSNEDKIDQGNLFAIVEKLDELQLLALKLEIALKKLDFRENQMN